MRKVINRFLAGIRGEEFVLDDNIPLRYMLSLFCRMTVSLIYGTLIFMSANMIFVHPSSRIKCRSKIKTGKGLRIDRNCFIDALSVEGIFFGNSCSIGKNTTIECSGSLKSIGKGLVVGNNVGMGTHGFFGCAGGVEIGDNTILGNYVSLHSENHNFHSVDVPIRLQGVTRQGIKIGKDCWLGAKVTVLDGAQIGDGCVVAAGAVVRGIIPPYSVVGGVPAKVIKSRNDNRETAEC